MVSCGLSHGLPMRGSGVPRPGIAGSRLYKSPPGVTVTSGGGQNKRWEESGGGMYGYIL